MCVCVRECLLLVARPLAGLRGSCCRSQSLYRVALDLIAVSYGYLSVITDYWSGIHSSNVHGRHGYWNRYAVCSAYVRSVTTQQIEIGPPHLAQPVGVKMSKVKVMGHKCDSQL